MTTLQAFAAGAVAAIIIVGPLAFMIGWGRGRVTLMRFLRREWHHAEDASLVYGDFPPLRMSEKAEANQDASWGGR